MSNLKHWNNLRTVPLNALKEIGFGKLKGKSDINPQWRYEVMTNEFGVCGIGWKYEIVKTWTQEANDNQVMVFVEINLYTFDFETGSWSGGIPAIGGDFLLEKDKNGLHGNDEAYKMATTDALGVAMKMLGVAADVYRGLANDSKYGREKPVPTQTPAQPQKTAPQPNTGVTEADKALRGKMVSLVKELNIIGEIKSILQEIWKVEDSKHLNFKQLVEVVDYLEALKANRSLEDDATLKASLE
jgi:hypothetical protein